MRKFLPLFLLLVFTQLASAQKKEEKKVRQTFENYKSAIMFDKGEEAAEYVDGHTLDYYSEMLDHTLHSDSAVVASLGIMDRLMIFSMRHRSRKEAIENLDGKGLFIYSIDQGMVGKSSVTNNEVGRVNIDGDFAKGQLVVQGQEIPAWFHFYKNDKEWKIDLTSIFPMGRAAFSKAQRESGMEENEYLFTLLKIPDGKTTRQSHLGADGPELMLHWVKGIHLGTEFLTFATNQRYDSIYDRLWEGHVAIAFKENNH